MMEIRGQLETYDVVWGDECGHTYATIRGRRTFLGIPCWRTLRTYQLQASVTTMSEMLPGPMRAMFAQLVQKYEDYEIAWREEDA